MDRAELINTAAGANENYRIGDGRELELGFLYGTAELITTLTLGPDESYSDAREAIARQIDLEAATGTYPLLSINGGPGRVKRDGC